MQQHTSNIFGRFRSWPITSVRNLESSLFDMGLKISAARIDGTSGPTASREPCLSDSLISVGPAGRGGTGSFISDQGLIITNWHVAHDAVRQASIKDGADYLSSGFVARSREEELTGADYEVWITKHCEDVSPEVVAVARAESDPLTRSNKIRDTSQALAAAAEARRKGEGGSGGAVRCDVQEMWPNECYVLFTYERLQDVRIVYVPPQALGNFGGDADNFEWPRHTADFTLLRAYVGPDGASAPPHERNVPYVPVSSLKVSEKGAQKGDFVFLLGFPGHTMRYAPSPRLQYSEQVAVPSLIADFGRKLSLISSHEQKFSSSSSSHAPLLALAGSKKSLANEFKRSKGKRSMMRKLALVAERQHEEERLCVAAPEAESLLARLGQIYDCLRELEKTSAVLEKLRGVYAGSALLYAGHTLHEAGIESVKPDEAREVAYRSRNRPFLTNRLTKRLADIHTPFERDLIIDALQAASEHCGEQLQGVGSGAGAGGEARSGSCFSLAEAVADAIAGTGLTGLTGEAAQVSDVVDNSPLRRASKEFLVSALDGAAEKQREEEKEEEDIFVRVARAVYPCYAHTRDRVTALLSERDELQASLLELQRLHSPETFYPDANGTLRFSAGFVEGYEAADAVWCEPITSLAGLQEKATTAMEESLSSVEASSSDSSVRSNEFVCLPQLSQMIQDDTSNVRQTPVNILYSTDTVGGNSGSPVLSARGEFVAINFDRQRQGLMNEFKWSPEYSRSIGVDVRYILWLIGEYDGAPGLVREMLRQETPT